MISVVMCWSTLSHFKFCSLAGQHPWNCWLEPDKTVMLCTLISKRFYSETNNGMFILSLPSQIFMFTFSFSFIYFLRDARGCTAAKLPFLMAIVFFMRDSMWFREL